MSISQRRRARLAAAVAATVALVAGSQFAVAQSTGRRVIGIDVSDWQNQNGPTGDTPINWPTVHAPVTLGGGGKDFAFIRSSRGGTTGTYNEQAGTGTLSHRYDDFAFVYNITQATANGMLAGPYHFARPDILTNTGADEADHMIQQAGNWMRPGYMLPVFDFEAGDARSTADLSAFSNDFANRIRQVKGITPIVYINQNYALNEIDSTVPAGMPNNWVARWPNQIYYDAVDHQNGNPVPAPVTQNVYGLWNPSFPQVATPEPWKFWQYSSRGRVPGIGAGAVAVDLDVAHGDMEYLKDFLIPAMWMSDASGDWSAMSQWNSDNPGYVAGNDATGPAPRLPNAIDTVILDRGAANPTITLSSGTQTVRKLLVRENLNITGGSLNVGYVPYTPAGGNMGSGPISAQFSSDVTLSGSGALSVHTLQVDATRTLNLNGGSLTFNTINLTTDSTTPAKILVGGDVNIAGLNGRTATINSVGLLTPGTINLTGGTRTFTVADGAAETDLLVNVGVTNGTLVKAGAGTMRLNTPISTFLTINGGTVVASFAGLPSITNNGTMVFDLPGGASAYGATIGGSGALIKRGAGSLDIGGTQTLTGPVTINDSTVRLNQTTGRLASVSSYTINNGALTLDNSPITSGNQTNRLANGAPISLNAGTINFIGAFTAEVAGALGALSGASTVALTESGGSSSSLSFASLARAPGATINFMGVGSGAGARIASGATPDAFLDQGTFVNGADYATTNGTGFVQAMQVGPGENEYTIDFLPDRHIKPFHLGSLTGSMSIRTLNLGGMSGTPTMPTGTTLTLTGGGMIHNTPSQTTLTGTAASIAAPADVEYVINTANASGQLTLAVPLRGGSGLTKTGPGTLVLSGANTYNGTTSIVGGKLVTSAAALGAGNLVLSGGATLQVNTLINTGRNVTLGPGGGIVDADGTFGGVIAGPGGFTKAGAGTLVLNSAANTYSGPTVITGGLLHAGQTNLGDDSASNTLSFQNGSALVAMGAIDMKRALTFGGSLGGEFWPNGYTSTFSGAIAGTGNLVVTGPGTLVLNGGANTHSGATHVANGATLVAGPNDLGDGSAGNVLRLLGGGRLRIADNLTMSRAIEVNFGGGTFDTDGYAATVSGPIGGGGTFIKSGFGPLTLTGPASAAFSGQVVVNNGTLRLAGPNSTLFGTAGYTINGGGTLKLDNHSLAGGNHNERLPNTAPITMNGGMLWLYGGPTTETAGNLTLGAGYNNIIVNGSTTSTLAFGAYARNAGATLNFLNASSTLKTTFTGGVTPGTFIDQGVLVGSNYAVYDAAGFVRAMAGGAGDSDFATAVTADRHVRLTATASGIATNSIYTMALVGNPVNATLAGGATLTLAKGGIISSGTTGNTISGGAAITTAPTTEIVVHTPETGDLLTISTPITGGSGLTKSGLGRVTLNSTGNNYGGATTVAGGTIRLGLDNVIPNASNVTVAAESQLDLGTRTEIVGPGLTMHSGSRIFSHTSNSIVSGGTLTLNGASTVITYLAGGEGASIECATLLPGTAAGTTSITVGDGDAAVDLAISANIQDNGGARSLNKLGVGTLRLAGGANSFSGNVAVTAGTLDVTGAITSGSGTIDIPAAGTLSGTGTIAKNTTLNGGVINLGASGTLGTLGVNGGTWKGAGGASGAVTVTGGTFTIGAGANLTANGGVNVTGGTLAAAHANSTITGNVTYASSTPGTWFGNITGAGKTLTINAASNLTLTGANTYTGGTVITSGQLNVTGNAQLGSGGVTTGAAGTLGLAGDVSYGLPLSIGGAGINGSLNAAPGSLGALDNTAGVNTWSGPITLNGTANNGGDPLLNQIGATAGTLVLSGAIAGGTGNSWAKTGIGDVVLTGGSPNTYTNLTRVFGGRLIIEKNQALGAAGSDVNGTGHTFELAGSASTVAFRAPASSPGGFSYTALEVINTEGTGAPGGFGQVDNLGGNNTFAGQIALAGPLNGSGAMVSSIGVTTGSLHVAGGIYARASGATPRDIMKLGTGRLIVSGDSSIAPVNTLVVPLVSSTLNVAAGTVEPRSPSATQTNLPGVSTWNVSSGAAVELASGLLSTRNLNVAGNVSVAPGGGRFVRTQQLDVTGSGKIDLADNDMIVDYTGANPIGTFDGVAYTGISRLLADSYNFGGWNSASGGITSSIAAAGAGLTTLAISDAENALGLVGTNTTLWNGQAVDGTSVLVMYTYAGDLNLDGLVDAADYGVIDNYFQFPGTSGYANGDFNYDGIIDAGDYGIIDNSFQLQGAPLGGAAAASGLASVTAVPEPAACAIAFVGAALALRRRRRRLRVERACR